MAGILRSLIDIYIWLVIIRIVLSWLNVDMSNQFLKILADIVDPVLRKIREFVPTIAGLDLSPLVLIVVLSVVRNVL